MNEGSSLWQFGGREGLGKGGSVEEQLYKKTSLYNKFEFSFSVTLCLPFKELFFSVF